MNIKTLQDLKSANQQFFAKGNKRFFGDIDYRLLTGKESKTKFLIQHTYQWSDMFGGPKKAVFVVKRISTDGKILSQVEQFDTLAEVKNYLGDS
jgi:hypothetical protein|tara:strand:- start:2432 stop:2713 length:282 start_codon:yes stop_codon:yes gene_type:complete